MLWRDASHATPWIDLQLSINSNNSSCDWTSIWTFERSLHHNVEVFPQWPCLCCWCCTCVLCVAQFLWTVEVSNQQQVDCSWFVVPSTCKRLVQQWDAWQWHCCPEQIICSCVQSSTSVISYNQLVALSMIASFFWMCIVTSHAASQCIASLWCGLLHFSLLVSAYSCVSTALLHLCALICTTCYHVMENDLRWLDCPY